MRVVFSSTIRRYIYISIDHRCSLLYQFVKYFEESVGVSRLLEFEGPINLEGDIRAKLHFIKLQLNVSLVVIHVRVTAKF